MFACIFFVFSPEHSLNTVTVAVFILLEFNFRKITGGPVCMGSRQTFCISNCLMPTETLKADNWHGILRVQHLHVCNHVSRDWQNPWKNTVGAWCTKSLEKQTFLVHDAQSLWKKTSTLGAWRTEAMEKPAVWDAQQGPPRCDALHPKQVWGRMVKNKPTDLCLHAAKRRGVEKETGRRERER